MHKITTIGFDIAKCIVVVLGADSAGNGVLGKKPRREEAHAFFASSPAGLVGMEACATALLGARDRRPVGRGARPIPPTDGKAYAARRKNDCVEAAAICEAVTRPSVRTPPIKTVDQQAARGARSAHELLSRQRVTFINALRGRMAEFGVLARGRPPACRAAYREACRSCGAHY